jgi:hypothetical protein
VPKKEILTEEIMNHMLCSVSDFSELTPSAAKIFVKYLNPCFTKSMKGGEGLGERHRLEKSLEDFSDLGWLETISDQTAKELSKCSAIEKINFEGVECLSDEAARHLAKIKYFGRGCKFKYDKHDNPSLWLWNVRSLSDKAIHYLSNYEGKELSLGIETLSENAAAALAKFGGKRE